jgi:hypothetical protein
MMAPHILRRLFTSCLLFAVLAGFPPASLSAGFETLPSDIRPAKTTRSNHYVVSNEKRHYLFKNAVENVGGVFVGVGSDQVYLMAAWAKPKILVPMDFDQFIVDLHGIYRLVFLESKTPDAFLELWSDDMALKKLIKSGVKDSKERLTFLEVLDFGRKTIVSRLRRTKKQYKKLKVPTFLTDQGQYDLIVNLFKNDKVFPVRGDLTKNQTMLAIGQAAKEQDLHIGGIYLSNAEQYFLFSEQYRANFAGLPFNDKSVVLRTLPDGAKAYYYYVQSGPLFQDWMKRARIKKVFTMLKLKRPVPGTRDRLFNLVSEPPKKWLLK